MAQSTKAKVERRTEELKSDLAARLKEVLVKQGLNKSELADRAGLKVSYVNRVLRKATNATLESIARLEIALNMPLIEKSTEFSLLSERAMSGSAKGEM